MGRRSRYRPWPRGPRLRLRIPQPERRRGSGPRRGLLVPAVLGIGLALLLIRTVDARARPLVVELAQAKARNTVTAMVSDTVSRILARDGVAYGDLVTLQTDNSGSITAMTTNSARVSVLRSDLLGEIVEQVNSLDSTELGIPLGNLTGLSPFSDWGPALPVQVIPAASAAAAFRNDFSAAGINQTLHRILLEVTVDLKLLIPGGTVESVVSTEVCIAETVIVGEVPSAYLQWN